MNAEFRAMTQPVLHMIETSGPGGAEKMLINHMVRLREIGIDSHALLIRDGWLKKQIESLGFKCFLIPLNRFFSPSWIKAVFKIIKHNKYQAIHSHEFAMNCHGAVLSLMTGVPAVATVHGKNYYADRVLRRFLYRNLSRFSQFVAVSADISEFLHHIVGIPISRLAIIPNGIALGKFSSDLTIRRRVRQQLNIFEQDYLVGAVGNLYPVKGHIHLVRAAGKIVSHNPNVKFVIAGRGGEEATLQDEISKLNLEKNFTLLGFREDVHELLQAFDIFAMPSLSEGLPLSILESMASQCVVVASRVGGIPELITDDTLGLLTSPADVDALASSIVRLIEHPKECIAISENAYALVSKKYSQDVCTNRYIELYKRHIIMPTETDSLNDG